LLPPLLPPPLLSRREPPRSAPLPGRRGWGTTAPVAPALPAAGDGPAAEGAVQRKALLPSLPGYVGDGVIVGDSPLAAPAADGNGIVEVRSWSLPGIEPLPSSPLPFESCLLPCC
jgi:hypothetical protein